MQLDGVGTVAADGQKGPIEFKSRPLIATANDKQGRHGDPLPAMRLTISYVVRGFVRGLEIRPVARNRLLQ